MRGLLAWMVIAALLPLVTARHAVAGENILNTSSDVFGQVKKCFTPPRLPPEHQGMQITVHFAFKRSGELLGHPRITYEPPEATDEDRLLYRVAIMEAFTSCTPFPLSESLGAAIAGHPFRLLIDDRRNLKHTERQEWLTTTTL